jgi:hypothetical protein
VIVKPDSPLRRIPLHLNGRQRMFLDAVRDCTDMVDVSLEALHEYLHYLAVSYLPTAAARPDVRERIQALTLAWTVIDGLDRIRGLIKVFPSVQPHSFPPFKRYIEATKAVRDLRNVLQHLHKELDSAVSDTASPLGELSWFAVATENREYAYAGRIISGTFIPGRGYAISRIAMPDFSGMVGHIELEVMGRKADLGLLHNELALVLNSIDTAFSRFLDIHKDRPDGHIATNMFVGYPYRRENGKWQALDPNAIPNLKSRPDVESEEY